MSKFMQFAGYKIPMDLVYLTGGGPDDWKQISDYHIEMYRKYTPINPEDSIVEIGCGVGRDAISLSNILSPNGKYLGTDIIKPSIDWAKNNITKKHKNIKFVYHDIESQIHNSNGTIKTTDVKLPVKDGSVDRIFLHSVFTHMFEKDIVHYLKEFRRILKPDGLVIASFFVMDKHALAAVKNQGSQKGRRHPLSFEHKLNRDCYINDINHPEGAVGFTPRKIKSMLRRSSLGIHGRFVHRGLWSGLKGSNGQDVLILEKVSPAEALFQSSRPMIFTER